jgi:hypothetical protein
MSSINRLRQINNNTIIITTNTFTNKKPNNTRTMEITEKVYDLLYNYSNKNTRDGGPMSYNEIIEKLCNFWNESMRQIIFITRY